MDHYYQNIQGWFAYSSIYDLVVKIAQDGSHFVEVGSWRGRSTSYLAVSIKNSGKNIKVDCIDTWKGSIDEAIHQNDPAVINDTLFDEFLNNLNWAKDFVNPIRMDSNDAVNLYRDNSLDFVMVDGSHEYYQVHKDISQWLKKVKPGGIIAGDDYDWPGVEKAVKEIFPSFNIITNTSNGFPSWLYIKE
jgi:predicted O-methyltransferase YrrM